MSTMMSDDFILEVPDVDSFKMWQGLAGPYFTPYIDEHGILSWTNTGGLVNPAAVSVIGPPGKGLEVKGVVATYADLPQNPQDGDTYLVGTEAPYDGYMWIDGEWVEIGDVSKGEAGRGIVSISKTGSSGLVDEYTILYTEGSPSVFYVTNGKDGVDGQDGQDGQDGVGVPTGGTTGQVLAKASDTNYDTEWIDVEAGGGTVQSVNEVLPDQNGNITLTADDINTDNSQSIQDDLDDLSIALDDVVYVGSSAPSSADVKIWLDTDEPGMSAVSSVNGKNGTVVLNAADVGAMAEWVLLWENASPTSDFSSQTVQIDLSSFDAIWIIFIQQSTQKFLSSSTLIKKGETALCRTSHPIGNVSGFLEREVTVSSSGVTIRGNQNFSGSYSTANGFNIPKYILGIKGVTS